MFIDLLLNMPHSGKGIYCAGCDRTKMAMALNDVRPKQLTQQQAAAIYGGVISDNAQQVCTSTIPVVAEQEIVNATLDASKSRLLHKTPLLCTKKTLKTPFKDGKPGKYWWRSFNKRHPKVTISISAQNSI